MRGLFCSRHVKDSDHVNTTVRVSGEVWSALLRAEGLWGSRISCKVGLTVVKMCVVWFPQQGKENTQAHHPPQYFCKHTTLISLSGSQNTFRMQNKGASRFLFSQPTHMVTLKLILRNQNSHTVKYFINIKHCKNLLHS